MCEECGRLTAKLSAMADEHRSHLKGLVADHQKEIDGLCAKLKSFEDWAAEESKEHGGDGKASATATLTAFRRDVCTLTGEKTIAGAYGVLKAHKQSHEEHAALTAALAKEKTATLSAQFETLLGSAVKDGKIPPAQKDYWLAQSKKMGSEEGLAMLSGFVATLSPVVNSQPRLPATAPAESSGLTEEQLAAARQLRISVESAQAGMAYQKQQLAQLNNRRVA